MKSGNDLRIGRIRGSKQALWLSGEQRGKHLAIFGGTGSGKSKLLEGLIRQDILAWPKSGSGVVLLDPHGALFDDLMHWIAANGFSRWPIIPIDLRRDDWVVAYNLLRQRDGDPAVFVSAFARAILHAWGQADVNDTPRLYKWLRCLLATLYELKGTLAEGLRLLSDPDLRRTMTLDLKDTFARTVWEESARLRPGEFHEEISSTVNRLLKFLSNQAIRATLCQTEVSLDLSAALQKGSIVLVCLGTAGGRIDEDDAATFGSILLSDLWTAAKARGYREGFRRVKPCYVYLDEFQEFLTPVMAAGLDQARKFGLHFTLAQQYPTQMLVRGDTGRQVYHSVMANCRNKIVFSLEHPEDLQQLALWLYRQRIDPDQIKHQQTTTKVMDYQLLTLPSMTFSETEAQGGSESEGYSHSSGTGGGHSHSAGRTSARTRGSSSGKNDGESYLEPDIDDDPFDDPQRTISHGESKGSSDSNSESDSESWSDNDSWSESDSSSQERSSNWSRSTTQGTTYSPMLMPIMGHELLPPQFRSIEEQLFLVAQYLAGQPDRRCVARLCGEKYPVPLVTFDVEAPMTTRRWVDRFTGKTYQRIPFALPFTQALEKVERRTAELPQQMAAAAEAVEPATAKRPITGIVRRRRSAD